MGRGRMPPRSYIICTAVSRRKDHGTVRVGEAKGGQGRPFPDLLSPATLPAMGRPPPTGAPNDPQGTEMKPTTVAGKLEIRDRAFVSLEAAPEFPAAGFVEKDVSIKAAGGQIRPVRGKDHAEKQGPDDSQRYAAVGGLLFKSVTFGTHFRSGQKALGRNSHEA